MKRHIKKGFTLIELLIVLTIFGVLISIAMLSWSRLVARSRIKAANNEAKVIFNAAQTALTDMKFSNRTRMSDSMYNMKFDGYTGIDMADYPYLRGGNFYFYYDGKEGHICDHYGDAFTGDGTGPDMISNPGSLSPVKSDGSAYNASIAAKTAIVNEGNEKLTSAIKKVLGKNEDVVFKMLVRDYNVCVVVCGRSAGDQYIGRFGGVYETSDGAGGVIQTHIKPTNAVKTKFASGHSASSSSFIASIQLFQLDDMLYLGTK